MARISHWSVKERSADIDIKNCFEMKEVYYLGTVIIKLEFLVRHLTHSVVLLTYQFSKINFLIPFTQILQWTDKIWAQFYKIKFFKN